MITRQDIIKFVLPKEDYSGVILNSQKAEIGGVSQIRDKESRKETLSEDQLVGQVTTYAASVVLTGSPEGYWKAREVANRNPYRGDGGVDIIGLNNVDIKGSMMRYSTDPLKYRLLVRPRERHDDWIYVLALIPKFCFSGVNPEKFFDSCFLVGWANDKDLPEETYNGSIKSLHGAYVVEAKDLSKIKDLSNGKKT